jgi:predicted ABC-type ATPase
MDVCLFNEGTEHELTILYYRKEKSNLKEELLQIDRLNQQLLSYKSKKDTKVDQPLNALDLLKSDMKNHQGEPFSSSCKKSPNRCKIFMKQWKRESSNTLYWLRFISYSIVRVQKKEVKVIISEWDDVWEKCTKTFVFPDETRRMIMGIGPSGCGKSTIAKNIFPWFKDIETVVFIDGGIAREVSTVWNVATAFSNGISDLYTYFKTIRSKDHLFEMLKEHNCSFYVPDTLSNTQTVRNYGIYRATGKNILPDITEYTVLDPNWIALFIWQHLNHPTPTCIYAKKGYPCIGCDVSGIKRQVSEGKLYDSKSYQVSLHASLLALKQSKHQFFIHNSGSADVNTIIAYNSDNMSRRIREAHPNLVMIQGIDMKSKTFDQINSTIYERLVPTIVKKQVIQIESESNMIQEIREGQQLQLEVLKNLQSMVDELTHEVRTYTKKNKECRPRCSNGTRRNKLTGYCDPYN